LEFGLQEFPLHPDGSPFEMLVALSPFDLSLQNLLLMKFNAT